MALKFSGDTETSQTIALKALGYLAADEELLEPFLGATGLAVASELAPETIVRARQGLPGALNDQ